MNPENDFYGHRYVLGAYLGLTDVVPRLRAHIQHGWAPFSPVGHRERLLAHTPFLAWNERDLDAVQRIGVSHAVLVGAPMLYLHRVLGDDPTDSRPDDGSMIFYPHHGLERDPVDGPHDRMAVEIAERATGPVTICLYWLEFRDARVRRTYENAGFRVISHGLRNDPGFLWRQRDELLRHQVVASNVVSTALWHGGSLGRDLTRFGPIFSPYGEEYRARWKAYQQGRWPDLDDQVLPGAGALDLAAEELGGAQLRAPEELAEIVQPVDADTHPWPVRMLRARTAAEFTGRRAFAIVRSRMTHTKVEEVQVESMRTSAGG